MSLAERVTQRPETTHGTPCSVGSLIASLDPAELVAFQTMMYGRGGLTQPTRGYKGWTEAEVYKTATEEGYAVAKNQINEHRGKRCRCYRDAR